MCAVDGSTPPHRLAGFPADKCGEEDPAPQQGGARESASSSSSSSEGALSWLDLIKEDLHIAARVINMTMDYGYNLDVRAHPQLPSSQKYHA